MTIFDWLIVLLLFFALFLRGDMKGNKKFIIVAFILLFAVIGLRDVYTGGSDASGAHGSYPVTYRNIGNSDWASIGGKGEHNFNLGFYYLMKLIFDLTEGNYQSYVTLLSLFMIFAYMRFIRKYSPSPIQSILYFLGLLYYTFFFDALKQALAMSVLLFAFDAIIEKRPVKYILIVSIGALIHFPALIFLPAYWLGRMKIGKGYLLLLAGLLITTYFFRDQILSIMLETYGGEEIEASMEGIRFLRNKAIVMIIIVVAAVILRPPSEGDSVYNACLVFSGIAIVFQTFCGYNNIFERLADYYFHTSIVFVPLVFEKGEFKTHVVSRSDELTAKTLGPWIVCIFSVWRFLSTVDNSVIFNGYRFLWQ